MAEVVFKDGVFTADGTDLSDRVVSMTLTLGAEAPDNTTMGNNTRTVVGGGLKTVQATGTVLQDYAASETDVTLYTIYNDGTAVVFTFKPTSGAISATNPEYTFSGIITEYVPIQGNVGDLAQANITIQPTGDVTRDITP